MPGPGLFLKIKQFFAHGLVQYPGFFRQKTGKMNHRIDGVPAKNVIEPGRITGTSLHKHRVIGNELPVPFAQIVIDDDLVLIPQQFPDGVTADVAGPTGDEDVSVIGHDTAVLSNPGRLC